jgi:ankyrin repeat protein
MCAKIIKILVKFGANLFAVNDKGQIPLTIVCQSKDYPVDGIDMSDIIDPLVQVQNIDEKAATVGTTIRARSTSSSIDTLSPFSHDKKDILNFRTADGSSVLHLAVQVGHLFVHLW